MSRKPTLEDALLLALFEARYDGLDITKWYMRIPKEFEISIEDFIDKVYIMQQESLVEYAKLGNLYQSEQYILTEQGKLKAYNIGNEINQNDFISLAARVSPEIETRKRIQHIETFIISSFLAFNAFFMLRNLLTITNYPLYLFMFLLFFFLVLLIITTIYSISSLIQILSFWSYYSTKYGKTQKYILYIFSCYNNNEKRINFAFKFIILPLISLLILIHVLGISIELAMSTFITTFIIQLIFHK